MRKTLKGTVWLLGVCLFFEVAVRVLLSLLPPGALTRGEDNASWRLRWAERRRAGLGGYAFDVYHPTRGWALRGGLKGERVFGDKTLSSSAMGVRGSEERSYRKTQGSARILVFGDSFTFGEDVSDDETYPFFLERTLGGIEVLNCGVQGYGHDQMFLYLREEGLRYKPDVVLLGFVAQDMERNLLEFRDFAKPRFDIEDGTLALRNTPVPTPDEVLRAERRGSRFLDLLQILSEGFRWRVGANPRAMKRITSAILEAFHLAVERAGAVPVFAYLPVAQEISADQEATAGQLFLREFCREAGIRSIDLRPAFADALRKGVRLKTEGHWDRREHQIAGRVLGEYLESQGIAGAGTVRPIAAGSR